MDIYLAMAFIAPIALVFVQYFVPAFNGKKTHTQGTLILVLAALPTMNLSFIPQDVTNALLAGAGIAVLIAREMTKRAK